MDSKVLQKIIDLRHSIHQHPEIGFEEFETRNKIVTILKEFGIEQSQMTFIEPTALYVDLKGKAEPSGKPRCIAFRAELDGLPMVEANYDLPYRSKVEGKAHMCGHQGHACCLVAFVPIFLSNAQNIPSDKTIRLVFQPSQQGPTFGAQVMIAAGCLQGVDQIYAMHQAPLQPLVHLWCKEGAVTGEMTILEIKIIGTSGHGSEPDTLKQSVKAAVTFYQKAMTFLKKLKQQKQKKFVCTLPIFQAGQKVNVISQSAFISGTIRSLEEGLKDIVIQHFIQLLQQLKRDGFQYQFHHRTPLPINYNTKQQAEHVLRVGRKVFGEDKAGQGLLPIRASQDFGFFTKIKPGAYFFLTSADGTKKPMLHNNDFDFNDNLIEPAAKFWWELAKDRLFL